MVCDTYYKMISRNCTKQHTLHYITHYIIIIDNMDRFLPACQTGLSGFVSWFHAVVLLVSFTVRLIRHSSSLMS